MMYRNRRKTHICIVLTALLLITAFSMTAWAGQVPGDGHAIDGTIHDVSASDVSKGSEMISAPEMPGSPDSSQGSTSTQKLDGPVSTQAPHKSETPDSANNMRISSEAPSAVSSGSETQSRSPVILCGSGKSVSEPVKAVEKEEDARKIVSLGMFTTTGYCNCEKCSTGLGLTYSGTVPKARHTISADISLFPIGTQLIIDGVTYTVEDIGSAVVGYHIDIYYDNHEDALAHGRQTQEVFRMY